MTHPLRRDDLHTIMRVLVEAEGEAADPLTDKPIVPQATRDANHEALMELFYLISYDKNRLEDIGKGYQSPIMTIAIPKSDPPHPALEELVNYGIDFNELQERGALSITESHYIFKPLRLLSLGLTELQPTSKADMLRRQREGAGDRPFGGKS